MKIAFVNQPIDRILPPIQSSVGACTYGVVRPLAQSCEVAVYGRKDVPSHENLGNIFSEQGVQYRFFPSTGRDRVLFKLWWKYARLVQLLNGGLKPPLSTSDWFFPDFGRQVATDLQTQQCDVIHVQHSSQYVPLLRSLNPTAKIVLHLHAEWFPQSNYARLAQRLQHVDLLTTVSDYITEKTRRDFPQIADRCRTVYNGIESSEFAREKDYRAARDRSIKQILYVGGVSPHKGVHVLIQAFERVVQRYPNVQLLIVGKQGSYPLEENYDMTDRALVKSLAPYYAGHFMDYLKNALSPQVADKVSFLGSIPRSELVARYFDADLFVFPSIWDEGFGIPPVEAMAAGVPVIVTRSGAMVETVQDGKTGLIVEKKDPIALAEAMLKLLEDEPLREAMGKAGRQRAFEQFTWEHVAKTLLREYEQLHKDRRVKVQS